MYTMFEKLNSRLQVQKSKGQNYSDDSTFAIVFVRAKYDGATVSICNFVCTISRLISMLTYDPGSKEFYFLSRDMIFELELLESAILSTS